MNRSTKTKAFEPCHDSQFVFALFAIVYICDHKKPSEFANCMTKNKRQTATKARLISLKGFSAQETPH